MTTAERSGVAAERSLWQIDSAHTNVEFAVKHMMIAKTKGRFAGVSGTLVLDEEDLARSEVDVTIDAASIDTRQEQREEHLRSPDFLDAASYPAITFRSRRIEAVEDGRFRVVGDLTIRGVTREAVLDATYEGRVRDPWGNERTGFSAETVIDRRDFGLTWNQVLEAGGVAVGNRIEISLQVEALKVAAQAAA
ncbi:MAG: YceI family protein [Gemmatimonadetes bacterium]|nr:YceI family protein [Gemmatimonadota bacterium]